MNSKYQVLLVVTPGSWELYLVSGESKVEEYEVFLGATHSIKGGKSDEKRAARDVFDLLYQCLQKIANTPN